ncbi:hypothetical protein IQ07DRAFT_600017 [Pyrenochaeta sp. DS3sAY3a]|nr:hypothetical protein IQ07DRAFT_600017 [Pyrenochaeta sp. DS3sAY3a]
MRGNRRERAKALSAIPNLACRDGRLIPVPVDAAPHGNPRLLFHDDMIGLRKEVHPALASRCAAARNRTCNMGHASHSTWIRCPICVRDNAHGCRNIRRLPAACTVPGWLTALTCQGLRDQPRLVDVMSALRICSTRQPRFERHREPHIKSFYHSPCRQCLGPFLWISIHPVSEIMVLTWIVFFYCLRNSFQRT